MRGRDQMYVEEFLELISFASLRNFLASIPSCGMHGRHLHHAFGMIVKRYLSDAPET